MRFDPTHEFNYFSFKFRIVPVLFCISPGISPPLVHSSVISLDICRINNCKLKLTWTSIILIFFENNIFNAHLKSISKVGSNSMTVSVIILHKLKNNLK